MKMKINVFYLAIKVYILQQFLHVAHMHCMLFQKQPKRAIVDSISNIFFLALICIYLFKI